MPELDVVQSTKTRSIEDSCITRNEVLRIPSRDLSETRDTDLACETTARYDRDWPLRARLFVLSCFCYVWRDLINGTPSRHLECHIIVRHFELSKSKSFPLPRFFHACKVFLLLNFAELP
jgi:hypothetical protein